MALVQTPGPFLLQQAAAHRLRTVPGHRPLGRHSAWRAFFFTIIGRSSLAAAVFCAGGGPRRFLSSSFAVPLLAVGAVLMTVDSFSVLFWTLAMLAGWRAVRPEARTRDWLWVGLWMGLGFLSKYTKLFQWLCWACLFPGLAARSISAGPGPSWPWQSRRFVCCRS